MKKIITLCALLAFIAGCSKTPSTEPDSSSSLEISQSSSLEDTSSIAPSSSSESQSSSQESSSNTTSSISSSSSAVSSSSSASSESSSSNPPDPVGVVKKTVSFLNGNFTNSSLDQAKSQEQFVNWFNNGDDVLASINYSGYAQMNYIGNQSDSWRFSTLILGSQNDNGAITFNFNYHVTSVKIVVQPYTKYISFTDSYNVDKNTTFIFDEKEYDLSVAEDHSGDTEKTTLTCAPNPEQNRFTIANKDAGQRVFVHSFELTYQN